MKVLNNLKKRFLAHKNKPFKSNSRVHRCAEYGLLKINEFTFFGWRYFTEVITLKTTEK